MGDTGPENCDSDTLPTQRHFFLNFSLLFFKIWTDLYCYSDMNNVEFSYKADPS